MNEKKDNFAKNLIDKIKQEKIEPKPRWHFLLKNYVVWLIGILSLIFGSLSTSVIIYLLKYNNWQLGGQSESFWSFFLMTLPYFWLLFLALFIFIIFYNLKHTKKGYKFKPAYIIIAAILISVLLGEIFYLLGMAKKIDDILGSKAPFYKEMMNPHLHYWCNPEKGRLAGVLIIQNDEIGLIDPKGSYWEIELNNQQITFQIQTGQVVNLLGKINEIENNIFEVIAIKQLNSGQEFIRRFRDRPCININCPHPAGLQRFENKWPKEYFQRFPEKAKEIGYMIRIKK